MELILSRLNEFLKGSAKPENVVIYGCGELGVLFSQFITQNFCKINVVGYVDSNTKTSTEQSRQYVKDIPVFSKVELPSLEFDSVLISSFRYQDEIILSLQKLGIMEQGKQVFAPDGDLLKLNRVLSELLRNNDLEGLKQLIFQHPEKSIVWQAFLKASTTYNLPTADSVNDVAKALSSEVNEP